MQKRKFGKIDYQPSLLGFGAMRFPTVGPDKKIDEAEAMKMVRHAIDQGVNYVDTAYNYHGGFSEILVGKVLQDGYREKVKLATKNPSYLLEKTSDWTKLLDEQLVKLQTDHIDFYLQHALNKERFEIFKKINGFAEAEKAKKDGKIKYFGFSFHDSLEVFKEIIDTYPWDFCQIQLNYLDTEFQAGLAGLKYAAAKGLPVIVMEPLKGGRLAGGLPQDIKALFDNHPSGRSPVEWALRWVADLEDVSLLLSGMSTMEHVEDNLRICSAKDIVVKGLNPEEREFLDGIAKTWKAKIKADCTDCRYCMPCPQGVNIPGCFALYNNASMFENWQAAAKQYKERFMDENADASQCVECGLCESACPQQLEIISLLKELHERFLIELEKAEPVV